MTKAIMMKCPNCSGTGIEEETTKSYRRYKCWMCEGNKEVKHPFPMEEKNEEENTH
tara:strand:+ start:70 stop:237 length:168 start_codon:yes stop_codon:yes gene_type:complete